MEDKGLVVERAATSTGAQVRQLRDEAGWSQRELAERVSSYMATAWRQSTVAKIEAGDRPLRWNEVLALSIVFKCTTDDLLPMEPAEAVRKLRLEVVLTDWEAFKSNFYSMLATVDPRAAQLFAEELEELVQAGKVDPEVVGTDPWLVARFVRESLLDGKHPEET